MYIFFLIMPLDSSIPGMVIGGDDRSPDDERIWYINTSWYSRHQRPQVDRFLMQNCKTWGLHSLFDERWGRCLSGDLCLLGPGPKSLWGATQRMAVTLTASQRIINRVVIQKTICYGIIWRFPKSWYQWYPQIIISHGWPWLSIETAMVTTGDWAYMSIVLGCTQLPRFWVVIVIHLYLDKKRLIGTY